MPSCLYQALGLLLPLLIVAAGCDQKPRDTVRVSGASTVYPIIQMASEELRLQGRLHVMAQAGGSTRGLMDTLAGRNELGAMARDLTDEENAQVWSTPIALDGIGIVVHTSNPVAAFTSADLIQIYTKRSGRWSDFGGRQTDIIVVSKAEGHATLQAFLDHTGLSRNEIRADVVAGNNAQVIQAVANARDAIGYVSMGEVLHAADAGMAVRLAALDGVAPALSSVADGSWPIRRKLYLICRREPQGGSLALIDYLRSEEGTAIIHRGGYVPLH